MRPRFPVGLRRRSRFDFSKWIANQGLRSDEIERSHEARRRIITEANTDLCGVTSFWG